MFKFFNRLGPGIVFAAMAIGVSHLVQSTRAGAEYGLSLLAVVVLASLLKYPLFRFAVQYSAITGKSLLGVYQQTGPFAKWVLIFSVLLDMFVSTAAVALLTAGVIKYVLGLSMANIWVVLLVFISLCGLLIASGYGLFEKFSKVMVFVFTFLCLVTVAIIIPDGFKAPVSLFPNIEMTSGFLLFLVAMAGWMPNPPSASFFLSAWSAHKHSPTNCSKMAKQNVKNILFDINTGYAITIFIAICFVAIGAILIYSKGAVIGQQSPMMFAKYLIELFTSTIGAWVFPIIGTTAIVVMVSTQFALMDGSPRMLSRVFTKDEGSKHLYITFLMMQIVGVILIIHFFASSFKSFIDFATSVSFMTAPFIAIINHKAMLSSDIPLDHRPSKLLQIWSVIGVISMFLAAGYFIYSKILM
ncbi:NRAMP family divalent metal transporter [Pseudoalteromonas sp. C12FD-1]|uniref:NRAMP family divalent metal transporter n=1 Tax=Pseudoalteromonas sp. C12FD-1 TaxID=3131979 RepID=UPI00307EE24B